MTKYNPEKRAWRGKSYKKGGQSVRGLKAQQNQRCCNARLPGSGLCCHFVENHRGDCDGDVESIGKPAKRK